MRTITAPRTRREYEMGTVKINMPSMAKSKGLYLPKVTHRQRYMAIKMLATRAKNAATISFGLTSVIHIDKLLAIAKSTTPGDMPVPILAKKYVLTADAVNSTGKVSANTMRLTLIRHNRPEAVTEMNRDLMIAGTRLPSPIKITYSGAIKAAMYIRVTSSQKDMK